MKPILVLKWKALPCQENEINVTLISSHLASFANYFAVYEIL